MLTSTPEPCLLPGREDLTRAMEVDGEGQASAATGPGPASAPAGGSSSGSGGGGGKKAGGPVEIVSQNAYLLVYRRRGADLPAVELDEPTQQW
jgi:hypothetical protein